MDWVIDKGRPICPQICEQLSVMIASGEYEPRQKLLSVREVALAAGVNPNTVQKAFEQLENKGLIFSLRGSGWYVSEDITIACEAVDAIIKEKTTAYVDNMRLLGCDLQKTKKIIEEWSE